MLATITRILRAVAEAAWLPPAAASACWRCGVGPDGRLGLCDLCAAELWARSGGP